MNRSGNVAAAFYGPHRHQVQGKIDRTEDQQVLLRCSLVNGAGRGPDVVGAMISLWPLIYMGGHWIKSHHLCLSVQQPHQREPIAALCTMTQKHVVHGQPGCTESSLMGAVPWMTLDQGS